MGHHYIPQAYLNGFCDPNKPGVLWLYDKQRDRFSEATVKKVAQERQFYSPEVEVELNELVERPANRAFDKLRAGLPIVAEDRERIAVYIATMLKRVPGHRQKTLRMAPQILEDTVSKLRNQIETAGQMRDIDPSIVARRLAELDATADQFQKRLPDDIIDQIRTPWPTEVMVELVIGMTWRFVSTEGPSYFLTSDNPAFFFEAYGLGNPESELTFTLTSNLALLGSRQTGGEGRVLKAKPLLVKEINRTSCQYRDSFPILPGAEGLGGDTWKEDRPIPQSYSVVI